MILISTGYDSLLNLLQQPLKHPCSYLALIFYGYHFKMRYENFTKKSLFSSIFEQKKTPKKLLYKETYK